MYLIIKVIVIYHVRNSSIIYKLNLLGICTTTAMLTFKNGKDPLIL